MISLGSPGSPASAIDRSPLVRLATAAVHGWMRVYTWRMPVEWAEARRAEIDSDLWELLHDPDSQGPDPQKRPRVDRGVHILARLLLGIPDDLRWRIERSSLIDFEDSFALRRAIAMSAAAAIVFLAFWILPVVFWGVPSGRTEVVECANAAATPRTRAEYREQVIACAGAFFTPRGQRIASTKP